MTPEPGEQSDWTHYPHDADIGVRGYGRDASEAFAHAAQAMVAAITPLDSVSPATTVEIECSGADIEMLFFDWMNAVIFEMATRGMLFSVFQVRITGQKLAAHASGEAIDLGRHAPAVEPKGATLTGLSVTRDDTGRWVAECIVDV